MGSYNKLSKAMGSYILPFVFGIAVNANPQFYHYQGVPTHVNQQPQYVLQPQAYNIQPFGVSIRNLQPILSSSPYEKPPALTSGTIVWQTRQLAEYVKLTLRQLSQDGLASPYINRILSASECLTSIEDAIVSIDASVRLLEDAEPEVLRLVDTVEAMQSYTDTETIVRVSADIVRQLGKLVPKLAPKNPQLCSSTPEVSFAVIRLVSGVLEDISADRSIQLTSSGRNELKTSAQVVNGVVNFIQQLGVTFDSFNKESCVADKNTNSQAISAIGDMMLSLGDMFQSFGGNKEAEDVRNKAAWVKDTVAAINKSSLVDVGSLDCNRPGDTSLAAQTLDDIADLIAEVGIEQLAKQLGVEQLI